MFWKGGEQFFWSILGARRTEELQKHLLPSGRCDGRVLLGTESLYDQNERPDIKVYSTLQYQQ